MLSCTLREREAKATHGRSDKVGLKLKEKPMRKVNMVKWMANEICRQTPTKSQTFPRPHKVKTAGAASWVTATEPRAPYFLPFPPT